MRRLLLCALGATLVLAACGDGTATPGSPPDPSPAPTVTEEPTPTATGSRGAQVTVTGTVTEGVEAGCVLLDEWLLVGGDASVLTPGAVVRVVGIPADVATTCQQGKPLQVLEVTPQ